LTQFDPLHREADMFRVLIWVVIAAAVVVGIVLLIRAI
jgi:hypothetical protein